MTDAQQFEVFMRNYQNMVFSTAMRLTVNQSEAEDIAQEVFLKAYERFGELRESKTAGGWLRTVATNMCLNHLTRYRARWRFFSEIFTSHDEGEETPVEFAAPDNVEDALAASDRKVLVEQALQKLPPAQRVPIVLFHMEGLSYEGIAARGSRGRCRCAPRRSPCCWRCSAGCASAAGKFLTPRVWPSRRKKPAARWQS